MTALLELPDAARKLRLCQGFHEDFQGYLSATATSAWTETTAVDGTVLSTDAAGGKIIITNAVASIGDNEDTYIFRKGEAFLMAANKPLKFAESSKFTQVSTNTVNSICGLTDAPAANLLVNDGAGPKTSGSTLAFYTRDGSLNWHIHASLSTTQTSVELTAVNSLSKTAQVAGGSTEQLMEIEFKPKNSTQADIQYFIDGVLVYKITDFVFTSATEMSVVSGIKGGTAAAASKTVDYISCYQAR